MNTRRNFLYGLGGLATIATVTTGRNIYANNQLQSIDNPDRSFIVSDGLSLKERAARKGIIYGSAIKKSILESDQKFVDAVIKECSILVPELELKWSAGSAKLRPSINTFDFTKSDWIVDFANKNKLLLRGHTLVWNESLPRWFKEDVNRNNARNVLEKHIQTVVKRYAGKINSWDVVNEAINVPDRRKDGLKVSPWLNLLGDNYIDLAFRLTHQANPQALLAYNETGIEYDIPAHERKRTALLKLLESLKSQGTPIHALGIQSHLLGDQKINAEKLRNFLKDIASLGLKILITELDVIDRKLPGDIGKRDRMVAAAYEDYLSVVLDEKAVTTVMTWGLSDKYTWLNEFYPRKDGKPAHPLPLDADMQRKLAWNAIARAFDYAPKR